VDAARVRYAAADTALGVLLAAVSPRGLCAAALGDDEAALVAELRARWPAAQAAGDDAAVARMLERLMAMIEGTDDGADLPLDVRGTAFQQRVWAALRAIPRGGTLTYTELAGRLGMPRSVRAVASACAANTLALVIPCHRVLRRDGSLAGFRWGLARKRELLRREAA
jgi:AraC family transcriptional regulator of adaptative response/methylated-DNA-[protein]-cysteine methyltransferase